jgi:hypothetical protein
MKQSVHYVSPKINRKNIWLIDQSVHLQNTSACDIYGSVHHKCIFKYNQQDATLHNVFISVKCSTCFRWVLRPSSGAQNCIHSIGYLSGFTATCLCRGRVGTTNQVAVKPDKYPMLCIQFWAPDDGRRTLLKHVEHFTEINTLCNVASCWLYLKIPQRVILPVYTTRLLIETDCWWSS